MLWSDEANAIAKWLHRCYAVHGAATDAGFKSAQFPDAFERGTEVEMFYEGQMEDTREAASRLERRIYGPLGLRDVHIEVVRWKREPAEREADAKPEEAARLNARVQGIKVTVVGVG